MLMLRLFTLLRPIFATGPVLQTNANAPPAPRRAAPAAARPQPALPPAAAAGVGESAFEQAFAPLTVGAVAALAALFQFVSLWTAVTLWALALVTTAWRQRRHAAAPPALPAAQRQNCVSGSSTTTTAGGPNCDEMEAAVYESALSHLRKQLFLKTCVVCLTEPREMVFIHPNGIEHAG